jgi:chromosome segregation ATPase
VATAIAQRSAELQQRVALAEAEKAKAHAMADQMKCNLGRLQATAAAFSEELSATKRSETTLTARCREMQAACQLANDEITALQTRCRALEQQCHALQDQYAVDMEALERAARERVQSVQSQAEETIAGLRRTSAMLQGRMSVFNNGRSPGNRWTGSTLAVEVDEAKSRLAAQAAHAERLEKKEEAVEQLLEALMGSRVENVEDGSTTRVDAAIQQAKQ